MQRQRHATHACADSRCPLPRCCEFLEKLDMTVNFIDVDTLEESVTNLTSNRHLRELYLMGNPCTSWEGLRHYVVARLPTLELLDGKQVVRSERILATQRLPALQQELQALAAARRAEKSEAAAESGVSASAPGSDKEDAVPYTPETRREMYMEIAERKAAEEKRRKEMAAPERDYDREHRERLQVCELPAPPRVLIHAHPCSIMLTLRATCRCSWCGSRSKRVGLASATRAAGSSGWTTKTATATLCWSWTCRGIWTRR